MPENTENYDLIQAAQDATRAQELEPGIYWTHTGGVVDIRTLIHEENARRPDRKTGATTLTNVDSFIDAITKHGLPETELYATTKTGTIRAIINAHQGTKVGDAVEAAAGHGDHTITLTLPHTQDWKDWISNNGGLMGQAEFAEFIEDHLPNFVDPSGADMLELAQTFQATTKVDFASSQRVQSGETQLLYKEEQNTSAGRNGTLTIPDTFALALQPFERGEGYRVQARFRYRIHDGNLRLGYRLTRPDDVLRDAFDQVINQVESQLERNVWHA